MSKPSFQFDKFIRDLEERESRAQRQRQQDTRPETENPRRKLDALYRERWQNRIRWGRR